MRKSAPRHSRGMLGIDSARNQACWPERSAEWYRACCIEARIVSGSGRMVSYPNLHLAFRAPLSSGWARSEVLEWPIDLPERAAVEAEQKRWRVLRLRGARACADRKHVVSKNIVLWAALKWFSGAP